MYSVACNSTTCKLAANVQRQGNCQVSNVKKKKKVLRPAHHDAVCQAVLSLSVFLTWEQKGKE